MRLFKLSILLLAAALFITACNKTRTVDDVYNPPVYNNQQYEIGRAEGGFLNEEDILEARENLDLQAVGGLLERANNAEDFEYLLNSQNGINNLDLNDDGYVDYISVREFDDRYDDERGFSLFSQFGPDLIQEIATVIFDRNGYNNGYYPGSRVLIRGNDYIYGDNYYYETNWMDRQVPFVSWVFDNRDGYYRSPYYYDNYPSYYEQYPIVETTVYQTRIERYYTEPVFVQTAQPSVTQVRIDSPYRDVSLSRTYATLPQETRQVFDAQRNKPKPAKIERIMQENKNYAIQQNRQSNDVQNRFDRSAKTNNERPQDLREMRDKPNKPEQRVDAQPQNQQKFDRQNEQRVAKEQQRVERQQQKVERQNQPNFERQNQPKMERQQQQQQMRVERQQQRQQQQVQRQQMRVERPQQPQQQRPQPQQQQMRQQQQQQQRPQPQMRQQPNNGGGNPNKGGGGGNPNKGGGNPNNGGGGGGKGKGKP